MHNLSIAVDLMHNLSSAVDLSNLIVESLISNCIKLHWFVMMVIKELKNKNAVRKYHNFLTNK